ncbi:nose resistant to fluoxetine protein 6-like isoform X2 [Anoplophora glabripennis]|uniref:nose resistant to fluoxetine protein 6-like isoform X2 n=1 Tax=Anoplophora glabripennis TaxID=217634 RepID=UPI000874339B|nr:nose resistant to fluoxetine protein 6-like isoform X2 [Anoplophora glabripennis]
MGCKWLFLILILLMVGLSTSIHLPTIAANIFGNVTENSGITSDCSMSIQLYMENLQAPFDDPWALRMLDATSGIPTGLIFSYNFGEMGNFKQCIETESKNKVIKGNYCLGTISLPINVIDSTNSPSNQTKVEAYFKTLTPFTNEDLLKASLGINPTWALCLPSNCTEKDALEIMNVNNSMGFEFTSFECQTSEDVNVPLSHGAIITICVLSLIVVLMFASTIYEMRGVYKQYKKPQNRVFTAFSIYSNGKALFKASKSPSEIACLNGIRFLSIVWVVSGHIFSIYTSGPVANLKDVLDWTNSLESMIMVSGTLSVDTFLVVGGTLVVYVFTKAKVQGVKFNIFKYYIHRYLRLTPALAAVVLVSATLLDYMGSGPKWNYVKSDFADNCKQYWWTTLLYVQNYCVGQTWYLNIDMQLYLISPIMLFLLWRYPKAGGGFVILCIMTFIVVPFYIAYVDEMAGITTNFYPKNPKNDFMNYYYLKTHGRAAPWFIGVLLGHILSLIRFRNYKFSRFNKTMGVILWAVCLATLLTCALGGHSTLRSPNYDRLGNSFYIALIRPVWALCVAWVIWACAMGYAGPVNTFLSHPLFQILNRFTYSIYLIHVTLLFATVFSAKISIYFTPLYMAYLFWGTFMFTFGISILWVLAFESPVINFEKIIFNKK